MGLYDQLPPSAPKRPQEWLVLTADGATSHRVSTPPGFDLMTVWGDQAVGVATGELDVQTVVSYPMMR